MKIAIDGREANGGDGKARYIREIIKGLSRNYPDNFQVTVLAKTALNFEINSKIEFCQLPKTKYPFSTNIWLRKKLKREKYDLFFAPTGYLPVLFSPIKTVVVIHDLAVYREDTQPKLKTKLIEKMLLPWTVKKSTAIIVPSKSTKNDILRRFGQYLVQKINLILSAMGNEFINQKLKREKFIFSVSTLEPRKNFITLLRAYQILPKNLTNQYRLKIAGNLGWNNHEFEEELKKANLCHQVDLLGRVEDKKLIELYNQTALFVYPSLFEGFGLPVLEAMSCGAPVITSANSSLPEAGGGGALYLKNPRDKEELARKMTKILADDNLRKELSDASLKQARKFSWDKTVAETVALFRRVVE